VAVTQGRRAGGYGTDASAGAPPVLRRWRSGRQRSSRPPGSAVRVRRCDRAGSDPPHGRLAVVVASTLPGPKPLPAPGLSSHRQTFLSSAGRTVLAHGSLRAPSPIGVTVLRHCTTPRRAPRGAGSRSVRDLARRRQPGYPPIPVHPCTERWETCSGQWITTSRTWVRAPAQRLRDPRAPGSGERVARGSAAAPP
jgi:hypothetical protein